VGGFKSQSKSWLNREASILRRTEETIAGVIVTRGTMLAPKKSGDLRNTGRVEHKEGVTSAVFGGNGVPYGRIQELGGITGRNYKTKITGTHYLKRAGDSVAKENIKKYYDMSKI
jgi:phage gpG-like protein